MLNAVKNIHHFKKTVYFYSYCMIFISIIYFSQFYCWCICYAHVCFHWTIRYKYDLQLQKPNPAENCLNFSPPAENDFLKPCPLWSFYKRFHFIHNISCPSSNTQHTPNTSRALELCTWIGSRGVVAWVNICHYHIVRNRITVKSICDRIVILILKNSSDNYIDLEHAAVNIWNLTFTFLLSAHFNDMGQLWYQHGCEITCPMR